MLKLAKKICAKAHHKWAFHAVVVEKGGAIIAVGYNKGYMHAEVAAMSKLWPDKRKGTKIWSIRYTPGGRLGMAKPCPRCESYLRECGVKVVMYSTSEQEVERMRL